MNSTLLLQIAGASLVVLSIAHIPLWRALDWGPEIARLSPINARVFAVHTFFIAFILMALGLLSALKPHLLLLPSELARLLLEAIVLFWIARLAIQLVVFDRVMRNVWTRSLVIRVGACFVWLGYATIYGAVLMNQLRSVSP